MLKNIHKGCYKMSRYHLKTHKKGVINDGEKFDMSEMQLRIKTA